MKISILTFSKEDNNGANLQCYALMKVMSDMGHVVEIIDIQLPSAKTHLLAKILRLKTHYNFCKFRNKYMNCFTRKYNTVEELRENPPQSDLYIVGSDQVWNLEITKRLDPLVYFFSFLPDDKRRISYAASFGVSKWTDESLKNSVADLLSKFESVSVREEQGVEICKNNFNIDAVAVCDPTLLLMSYDEICGSYDSDKQTNEFIYFKFSRNKDIEKFLVNKVQLQHGKIVKLGDFHPSCHTTIRPITSIKSWLNSIRYAQYVLTDSFHCMVFCILFRKQFIVMPSSSTLSSRMKSLLGKLNLSERFCEDENELYDRFDELYHSKKIEYNHVFSQLNVIRKYSLNFLQKSLN